ncbi:hypothetical protein Pfra02_35980 [Pseudomonas fragi]|nr:hypothetical protein Pfra02_35980 [Pseudomonas fragi]
MQPWEIASLADDGCQSTEGWMTVLSGWGGCFVIGLNGASGKNALTARQRLSWIHNRPAVLPKAVTTVTVQAKK